MNKKATLATITAFVLLTSTFMTANFVKANPNVVVFPDAPIMTLPILTVRTPTQNGFYLSSHVTLDFNVTKSDGSWFWGGYGVPPSSAIGAVSYILDGKRNLIFYNDKVGDGLERSSQFIIELDNLTRGTHEVGIEIKALHFYGGLTTTPQRVENTKSVSIIFNVADDPPAVPSLLILSPANDSIFGSLMVNDTFPDVNIPLVFTTNETLSWAGYSIDGNSNVTILGNTTIVQDPTHAFSHNLTLYANNTYGTWATPQTVQYHTAINIGPVPSPTPSPPIEPTLTPTLASTQTPKPSLHPIEVYRELVAVLIVLAVAVGLLVYFRERRRKP